MRRVVVLVIFSMMVLGGSTQRIDGGDIQMTIMYPKNIAEKSLKIYEAAVEVALHEHMNYTMDVVKREIKVEKIKVSCHPTELSEETSKLIYTKNIDVFIGPPCKEQSSCDAVTKSIEYNKKIGVFYQCNGFETSQYITRVRPVARDNLHTLTSKIDEILSAFNWRNLGVIYTKKIWGATAKFVKSSLNKKNVVRLYPAESYRNITELTTNIKKTQRSKIRSI